MSFYDVVWNILSILAEHDDCAVVVSYLELFHRVREATSSPNFLTTEQFFESAVDFVDRSGLIEVRIMYNIRACSITRKGRKFFVDITVKKQAA